MKKKITYTAAALALALVFALLAALPAFADEALTVNGEPAKVGDTITFEFRMSGVSEPLEAAGAFIEYDANSLEYIDGSIGFDVLKNAMYNIVPGKIYYSAIDIINGYDITEEHMIVKLSFTVLDGAKGDLTITNTFDEIFTFTNEEEDLSEDEYSSQTLTTVNTYVENDAPSPGLDANKIEEFENSSDTNLDNYMLGTDKEELIASNIALGSEPESVASAADGTSSESTASAELQISSTESEKNGTSSKIIVIAIAAVFVLLIAGVVVFSVLSKKKSED